MTASLFTELGQTCKSEKPIDPISWAALRQTRSGLRGKPKETQRPSNTRDQRMPSDNWVCRPKTVTRLPTSERQNWLPVNPYGLPVVNQLIGVWLRQWFHNCAKLRLAVNIRFQLGEF
ncbi:MAG: hypothetical protein ACJAZ1_001520 [Yoonia sp.]|jgi:hypothetical protein